MLKEELSSILLCDTGEHAGVSPHLWHGNHGAVGSDLQLCNEEEAAEALLPAAEKLNLPKPVMVPHWHHVLTTSASVTKDKQTAVYHLTAEKNPPHHSDSFLSAKNAV